MLIKLILKTKNVYLIQIISNLRKQSLLASTNHYFLIFRKTPTNCYAFCLFSHLIKNHLLNYTATALLLFVGYVPQELD